MIIIRAAQLALFGSERRRAMEAAIGRYLREQFPGETVHYRDHELLLNIRHALTDAAVFDLHAERDCYRYLSLALLYGWDFPHRPELDWMRTILSDARISAPGRRLERLVQACLQRRSQERERLRIAIDLGIGFDDSHDDDVRLELKNTLEEASHHE